MIFDNFNTYHTVSLKRMVDLTVVEIRSMISTVTFNQWITIHSPKVFIENQSTYHIDGLVQDCSNSIAYALELLQSCTKPSTSWLNRWMEPSLSWILYSTQPTLDVWKITVVLKMRFFLQRKLCIVFHFCKIHFETKKFHKVPDRNAKCLCRVLW